MSIAHLAAQANIPLKEQDKKPGSIHPKSERILPVSAYILGSELSLNFDHEVGLAAISIYDEEGAILHANLYNTDNVTDITIQLEALNSGNYTIWIEYEDTILSGNFEIY